MFVLLRSQSFNAQWKMLKSDVLLSMVKYVIFGNPPIFCVFRRSLTQNLVLTTQNLHQILGLVKPQNNDF
jgi:hypothetical protein